MDLGHLVISLVLGLIPEIIFFNLFFIKIKGLKTRRIPLIILTSLCYTLFIIFNNRILLSYVLFTTCFYLVLKLLYKNKINFVDLFFLMYSEIYLSIISFICFKFVTEDYSNYFIMLAIERILVFVPFIFMKYVKIFYNKYCQFWNRNDKEHRPLKSITLRNISIIILNIFILVNYLVFAYINH